MFLAFRTLGLTDNYLWFKPCRRVQSCLFFFCNFVVTDWASKEKDDDGFCSKAEIYFCSSRFNITPNTAVNFKYIDNNLMSADQVLRFTTGHLSAYKRTCSSGSIFIASRRCVWRRHGANMWGGSNEQTNCYLFGHQLSSVNDTNFKRQSCYYLCK